MTESKDNTRIIVMLGYIGLMILAIIGTSGSVSAEGTTTTNAVTHEITVTGSNVEFTPSSLSINIGDTIYFHWENTSMGHNVAESSSSSSNEYKAGGFRSGEVNDTVHYNVTFEEAGTFYFICEPHTSADMRGSITVIDPNAPESSEVNETPGFAVSFTLLGIAGAALTVLRDNRNTA